MPNTTLTSSVDPTMDVRFEFREMPGDNVCIRITPNYKEDMIALTIRREDMYLLKRLLCEIFTDVEEED